MKIVAAGATGFIGRALVPELVHAGHEVVVLSRRPGASGVARHGAREIEWDGRHVAPHWANEIDGAGAVVNLAGVGIGDGLWTAARRVAILKSRTDSTDALVEAMGAVPAERRPECLINASGIGYYGDRGDEILGEDARPGTGFLAETCVEWEKSALAAEPLGVRTVLMRTAVVFGKGALQVFLIALPFRLFAGGPLGDGSFWFPWIHLDDMVGMYKWALENRAVRGAVNATSPDVRRQRDFAKEMGKALGRPSWLPTPAFALRLALGDFSSLVLNGQRAEPRVAQASGYAWRFPTLTSGLSDIFG
jgi:uncharacterized protein (TIGR01777 family)